MNGDFDLHHIVTQIVKRNVIWFHAQLNVVFGTDTEFRPLLHDNHSITFR